MLPSENIKIQEKNTPKSKNKNLNANLILKIETYQNIIKKTILAVNRYKMLDIFGANELNICMKSLETIFKTLSSMIIVLKKKQHFDIDKLVERLQELTVELSSLFKIFGTQNIEDLILICIGNDFIEKNFTSNKTLSKFEIMKRYVHPIGYKIMNWKHDTKKSPTSPRKKLIKKNRIVEDFMIVECADNLDCYDLARTSKAFQTKVYGIKFAIHCHDTKKTLIIAAIVDDIMLECLNYSFIEKKLLSLETDKPSEPDFTYDSFNRFLESLTLKELLVYDNQELYNKYIGYINQVYLIKQKPISQVTTEFISNELYGQRTTLIQLLLKSREHEYQYLSYLLYDLLSNDLNGNIDTQEQTLLFDSLPWNVKKYFRDAMKQTVTYTNNLSNFDSKKIPLEQQICLMKADEVIKEKAMLKLKEVNAKSEDSGSKARQFLEGLLKIPFGIYKEEPILKNMGYCTHIFNELIIQLNKSPFPVKNIPIKDNYTSMELQKYTPILQKSYASSVTENVAIIMDKHLTSSKRDTLISNICYINNLIKSKNINYPKICHSGKKTSYMKENISLFIKSQSQNYHLLYEIAVYHNILKTDQNILTILSETLMDIEKKTKEINSYIKDVGCILDNAVHGHSKAKRQIERIIGQWINGDTSGYCFGFEGPPGVGKTSLAKKGIANCLTDHDGITRPFAFIAIGGSTNGSTIDGHNYTYVGSTWGRIVDILMEKKCMNPIIFIDELDKVSRTEHGKEIIGILTHLIDPTQNDTFQDKYFNGIDLDLSKALFIFSYNDIDAIDRILLDRIHRIKFEHLSIEDKLTVTKDYLFPEIYGKMGLMNMIDINDNVIEYIIQEYTCEPGVRKLKELLFEIVGEINLSILKDNKDYNIPVIITINDIKYKYLKDKHEIRRKVIHSINSVGLINGLWANALGNGGVLPIEAHLFPCQNFLELKLTGMQGDVMKESMTVAKTLAWELLDETTMKKVQKKMDEIKLQGIHIHVPEGSTPKDGPSAGTAITTVLYSLLTNKFIKHDVAITGEICLQGKVTAIGGLDLKILGGIRAGVKTFIYPKENDKDFKDFMDIYEKKQIIKDIDFIAVENIHEVLKLVIVD
tara:strand:+ start:1513 stop:4806 length:3294 start_codon:yes stop_codon:yes gene_type:complete